MLVRERQQATTRWNSRNSAIASSLVFVGHRLLLLFITIAALLPSYAAPARILSPSHNPKGLPYSIQHILVGSFQAIHL